VPQTGGTAACAPAQPGWDPRTADIGSKTITVAFEQEPDQVVSLFSTMSFAAWIWQMVAPGARTLGQPQRPRAVFRHGNTEYRQWRRSSRWAHGHVEAEAVPVLVGRAAHHIKRLRLHMEAMKDPGNAPNSRSGWDKIASIDTPDNQTAVIHFRELYPSWPTLFDLGPNNTGGGLLPEHLFQGKTALEKDPQIHQPSWAAGPFAIKEWVAGDHMTMVRNPNFFGSKPKLDSIQIKFVSDPETGLAALKTGDVDFMVNLAESDIDAVKALAPQGVHLRVDHTPNFEHLFFNLGTTAGVQENGKVVGQSDVNGFCPFQDPNVRKVIAMGIDRLAFIKDYLKEDEQAYIATLWPNSVWTDKSIQPYPYAPAQAASLLDAAGYKVGPDGIRAGTCKYRDGSTVQATFSIGLETSTAQRRVDNMAAIQADLKKIGIDVKPNPIPAGPFFGSYTEGADIPHGKYDMAIYTTGFFPDPDPGDASLCSGVPNKDNPTGGNSYHACDPKLDQLFAAGLASADAAARKKAYDAIQQYLYDQTLIVALYARETCSHIATVFSYRPVRAIPMPSGMLRTLV
jgi:peptide/nickel transport system substrate-binding protein